MATTITTLPDAPSRADPATFSSKSDALLGALATFVTETNTVAGECVSNAATATTQAGLATTNGAAQVSLATAQVVLATEQVALATTQATNSANSATASANSALVAGAIAWVSGTTYAIGDTRYSPIDFQTYRRTTSGAGTTDPSADSANWTKALVAGVTSVTNATTATTLTSTPTLLKITPASYGVAVTLPDATTCSVGGPVHIVDNRGFYPVKILDSTGTLLGFVGGGVVSNVNLDSNSTAAGVWSCSNTERIAVTAEYFSNALLTSGTGMISVIIDSDRTLLITTGNTSNYAVIYNSSTLTWGTAVLVRASASTASPVAILSAANQVLVCSSDATTGMETVVLSISTNTITVNAAVATTLAGDFSSFGHIIAVGSSFVVSYGRATNVTAIRAITISGTVPTIGAESALTPAGVTPADLYASGSVVRTISSSASFVYAKPFTVSGSTLSAGTEASVGCTAASRRSFLNGNGNIVAHYINTTHYATIFKLTSTTEAASSVDLTGGFATAFVTIFSDYCAISASKTAFFQSSSSNTYHCNILTDTGGTASAGTAVTGSVPTLTGICGGIASGNNAYFAASSSGVGVYQFGFDCSGASPAVLSVYASLTNTAAPSVAASNQRGEINASLHLVGVEKIFIAYGVQAYSLSYTATGIKILPRPANLVTSSIVKGWGNADSFATLLPGAANGRIIQRVECAA